jgi:hypothetical protein
MDFFRSMAGRILALSVAIALLGGSAAVLVGGGEGSLFLLAASLFLPVVMNIVGLPTAIEEHWTAAVLSVILLPVLLFLWAIGIAVIRAYHHHALVLPFLAAGLAALVVAARPSHELTAAPTADQYGS